MIPKFRLEDVCVSPNTGYNPITRSVFKVDPLGEGYTVSPTEDCCFGRNPPNLKETQKDIYL